MDRWMIVAAGLLLFLAGCANASPSSPGSIGQSGEIGAVATTPAELRTVELSSSSLADPSLCAAPSVRIFDHANLSLDDGEWLEVAVDTHLKDFELPGGVSDYPDVEIVKAVFPASPDRAATVMLLGGSNGSDRLARIDLINVASPPLPDGWVVGRTSVCSPGVFQRD